MNDEATQDWNGTGASDNRKPKAPQWDGAAVPPPSDQTPPWETPPPNSGPPSPWGSSRPNSVPPSPWGSPQPDSGPPAPSAPGDEATWPLSVSAPPQTSPGWGRPEPVSAVPAPHSAPPAVSAPAAPRPPAGKRVAGWIAGIVVAALAAGAAGFYFGTANADGEPANETTTGTPASTGEFEALQVSLNKSKLDGELAAMGDPWLTSSGLDSCVSNTDKGAGPLNENESRHVTCRYATAWVHFIVYKSPEQKDTARSYWQQLNFNSDAINPGVQDPSRTTGGVSKASGKLIEYATRNDQGVAMCGVFWEREDTPLTVMQVDAPCEEGLGGKWDLLRDLWQRHS
ncbi:hypothetical protein AB0M02_22685 [Actinoplanes sp. NPDC051861]|uniref:hypothetical protein n=1 Tax=Actinoplanes sp. NPDC051861 TaxID=3155170 RepID=UPI0034381400